jgi:hypothetical protein
MLTTPTLIVPRSVNVKPLGNRSSYATVMRRSA